MIVTPEQLKITRKEWECYIDTPDDVIEQVNLELLSILNSSTSPRWAQKRTYDFFEKNNYMEHGFLDSECMQVATNAINKYYNSSIDRWESMTLR